MDLPQQSGLALRHLAGQPMTRDEALGMRGAHAIRKVPTEAMALEPEGAERDRLFAERCAATPNFKLYQDKTERRIPIIVLERCVPSS